MNHDNIWKLRIVEGMTGWLIKPHIYYDTESGKWDYLMPISRAIHTRNAAMFVDKLNSKGNENVVGR